MGQYRGRAVKRIRGQRRLKAGAPVAKFTMTKNFTVVSDSSDSSVYAMGMDVSTPFNPLFDVVDGSNNPLGEFQDNDSTIVEPLGLDSDLYTHYNYLVVKGCHVSASVTQAPDQTPSSKETLTQGQVTLARMADIISEVPTTADMKTWFGQKTSNFQLSTGNGVLTKNAYVSNGYSARKQFNVNANANEDLKVVNTAGSSNQAEDKTYMYLIIKPRKDYEADGNQYLKPLYVTLKLSYIIQFQDPNKTQSVPLPISTRNKRISKKRGYKANAFGSFNPWAFGAMAAPAAYAMRGLYAANRMVPHLLPRAGFNQRIPGWLR